MSSHSRSRALFGALLFSLTLGAALAPLVFAREAQPQAAAAGDFDGLVGTWKNHHRRLDKPFSGSTRWLEFDGTSVVRQVWDGRGNIEELDAASPIGRIQGVSLRLFDARRGVWSIYWSTAGSGALNLPATVGSFHDGRGEFYDDEELAGRPIRVRNVWSRPSADTWRWEQAFSADGGKTWETNWTTDYSRR